MSHQIQTQPLLDFDGSALRLAPQAPAFLASLPKPLSVVSFIGKARTGKSCLANRLFPCQKGFPVGSGISSGTKGVMARVVTTAEMTILLLDCEGFGKMENSESADLKTMSLVIALSSVVIYNSMGCLDQGALNQLFLLLKLAQGLERQHTLSSAALFWVLRDFGLQLVDREGNPLSSSEYLQQALSKLKGETESIARKNSLRSSLRQRFPERKCFTLVRPLDKESDFPQFNELADEAVRPLFLEQLDLIRRELGTAIRTKRLNGKDVDGHWILQFLQNSIERQGEKELDLSGACRAIQLREFDRFVKSLVADLQCASDQFFLQEVGRRRQKLLQYIRYQSISFQHLLKLSFFFQEVLELLLARLKKNNDACLIEQMQEAARQARLQIQGDGLDSSRVSPLGLFNQVVTRLSCALEVEQDLAKQMSVAEMKLAELQQQKKLYQSRFRGMNQVINQLRVDFEEVKARKQKDRQLYESQKAQMESDKAQSDRQSLAEKEAFARLLQKISTDQFDFALKERQLKAQWGRERNQLEKQWQEERERAAKLQQQVKKLREKCLFLQQQVVQQTSKRTQPRITKLNDSTSSILNEDRLSELLQANKALATALERDRGRIQQMEGKIKQLKAFRKICKNGSRIQCANCHSQCEVHSFLSHLASCAGEQPIFTMESEQPCTQKRELLISAKIVDVSIRCEEGKPMTLYRMQVVQGERRWEVVRKYKQFCQLNKRVRLLQPPALWKHERIVLPEYSNENISKSAKDRLQLLQSYLDFVLTSEARNCSAVSDFLDCEKRATRRRVDSADSRKSNSRGRDRSSTGETTRQKRLRLKLF